MDSSESRSSTAQQELEVWIDVLSLNLRSSASYNRHKLHISARSLVFVEHKKFSHAKS